VRYAQAHGVNMAEVTGFRAVVGRGVEAQVDGQTITIGSAKLFTPPPPSEVQQHVRMLESAGKTVMLIQQADRFIGLIALADQLRPESKAVIASLKQQGVLTVMLTGIMSAWQMRLGRKLGLIVFMLTCSRRTRHRSLSNFNARLARWQ
jgi:P-type E1-E2 ATPase